MLRPAFLWCILGEVVGGGELFLCCGDFDLDILSIHLWNNYVFISVSGIKVDLFSWMFISRLSKKAVVGKF